MRASAHDRCGYCLAPQDLIPVAFEIEHIIPRSKQGSDEEHNLWLACPRCNRHKSNKTSAVDPQTKHHTALFNPRTQVWSEHFQWSADGLQIIGLTPIGRATVIALKFNDDPRVLKVRANWITAGWHPPTD